MLYQEIITLLYVMIVQERYGADFFTGIELRYQIFYQLLSKIDQTAGTDIDAELKSITFNTHKNSITYVNL